MERKEAIRSAYRVLKPGGIFCGCFYVKGSRSGRNGLFGTFMKRRDSSHRPTRRPSV